MENKIKQQKHFKKIDKRTGRKFFRRKYHCSYTAECMRCNYKCEMHVFLYKSKNLYRILESRVKSFAERESKSGENKSESRTLMRTIYLVQEYTIYNINVFFSLCKVHIYIYIYTCKKF